MERGGPPPGEGRPQGENNSGGEGRHAGHCRLTTTSDVADFKNKDFAIEAVSENPALKWQLLQNLDNVAPKHAILATNTSFISITKIAASTQRPEEIRNIGDGSRGEEGMVATGHMGENLAGPSLWPPLPSTISEPNMMKLIEINPGLAISHDSLTTSQALVSESGKTTHPIARHAQRHRQPRAHRLQSTKRSTCLRR
ncbi:3-hydroxyacyl-CoA dehydrogenase [Blyttiomyces helicus]|uniref:3-hydroxyacyl-CoA dehydrogenase n=1 Tax=Blyttiomyces helicus TaxID=388810 RepID=A0A4P9W8H3_9FUNG|nr:3-hydroxyacyl-CoA dehydrogenase [Blyttiomyces helicus]|eukprot:RKO88829.1 3-hydroxyacyl-CoA dehydrogenase [Blyttiomyces helicus]